VGREEEGSWGWVKTEKGMGEKEERREKVKEAKVN